RRGPNGIELPDSLGDRDLQAVPGEAQPAAGAACLERRRLDPLPLRVVEIGGAGVRADVVGSIWGAARLQIGPGGAKADRHDLGVAVAPLAMDESHALRSAEIDDRFRTPARWDVSRSLRPGRRELRNEQVPRGVRALR